MLPLSAAHPTEHDRNALTVGELDHGIVGNFGLPADEIQAEVFYVPNCCRITRRVILEEQIRRVDASPNQVIPPIDL